MNENANQVPGPASGSDAERAAAYVRDNREHYTREAVAAALRAAGYDEATIDAAMTEFEATEPGPDLRTRASLILFALYGGTWLLYFVVVAGPDSQSSMGFAALVLGFLLGIVLLASLTFIQFHKGLQAGVEGALATALTVPLMLYFAITGVCVATTMPFLR